MIGDHVLFLCSSCWIRKHRSWFDIKVGKACPMHCMVCQCKVPRPASADTRTGIMGMLNDRYDPAYKLPRE